MKEARFMYQCKYYFPNPLYLFLLIPFSFGIFALLNSNNPFLRHRESFILLGLASVLGSVVSMVLITKDYVVKYNHIYKAYRNGEYRQISGEVVDFHPKMLDENGFDAFTVNGVMFRLENSPGYHKPACLGGLVDRNHICVEIKYIEYKNQYYIMYLKILTESLHDSENGR